MAGILLPTYREPVNQEKKEDSWDKVMKGLQVANLAFGVADKYQNVRRSQLVRELTEKKIERMGDKKTAGTFTTKEFLPVMASKNLEFTTADDQQAFPVDIVDDEDTGLGTRRFYVTKASNDQPKLKYDKVVTTDEGQYAYSSEDPNKRIFLGKQGKLSSDKSFELTQDQRDYWESRGITPTQLDMVSSGYGGRNPTGTLNTMAERDEPTNQQINTLKAFDESELVLKKMVNGLGTHSEWVGPVDGRVPEVLLDGDQVGWRSTVGRFNDLYRKAITGAGASVKEIETLETRLPQPKDTFENFKAKANKMMEELAEKRDMYIESLEKGGQYVSNYKKSDNGNKSPGGQSSEIQTAGGKVIPTEANKLKAIQELKRRQQTAGGQVITSPGAVGPKG